MESELPPLKSIMSRGGSARRDRHVRIQGNPPDECTPYSLQRSLSYLNDLITQVEQASPTNSTLKQTADPVKVSYSDYISTSPSRYTTGGLECNTVLSRMRPLSASRQTDHWMLDTDNPQIQRWLK